MLNPLQKAQFPGWFVGTCSNTTCGLAANLLLLVHSAGGRMIQGELGLSGDLVGGGPFNGNFDGEVLVFKTCTPTLQTSIEWRGRVSNSIISGTYSVVCEHPELVLEGLAEQQGIWSCAFVRSLGTVEPQRSELVCIFNEDRVEGPISRKEFLNQVSSGRWPDKAIVAFEDCTAWATVYEFLNQKTAGEN